MEEKMKKYDQYWRDAVSRALDSSTKKPLPGLHRFYAACFMVWWYLDLKPALPAYEGRDADATCIVLD
jgi:hypothetical protein